VAQAYLTNAEFLAQTIPGAAFSQLTSQQITDAILWASSTADSYLRKRYTLPLISWGVDLKRAVGKIVALDLLTRNGFRPGSGNDEIAVMQNDAAIKWLRDVSTGVVELDCVDSTPDADEQGSLADSSPRVNWTQTTGPRSDDDE
jgi:phage gp36-like protein